MSNQPVRTIHLLLKWFVEAGVMHFDLAVQRRDAGSPKEFLAPRFTQAQQLEVPGIAKRLSWLRAENAHGSDIYFRPYRHGLQPMVFLDDLPPTIALKIAEKYRAAVIETSPNRCHLWLSLASPLDEWDRTQVQRDLVDRLQGAADPGSISGDHWGRLPGFRNRKPRRNCWVNLRLLTRGHPYLPIREPISFHRPSPRTVHDSQDGVDMSRQEWGWVLGCLENGLAPSWVLDQLIKRARGRRGDRDATRYAQYTVKKACRISGLSAPF